LVRYNFSSSKFLFVDMVTKNAITITNMMSTAIVTFLCDVVFASGSVSSGALIWPDFNGLLYAWVLQCQDKICLLQSVFLVLLQNNLQQYDSMMTACQSSQDTMLELYRQTRTKLPLVHTNSSTYVSANATIHLVKISIELAKYYHASYGTLLIYPAPSYRLRSSHNIFWVKNKNFIHTSHAQHSYRTGTSGSGT